MEQQVHQHDNKFTFFTSDLDISESLDDSSKGLFAGLSTSIPTLEEAFSESGIQDIETFLIESNNLAFDAMSYPEIDALSLTHDEAAAISSYTLHPHGCTKSSYDVINGGLAGSRDRGALAASRKLLFLFLSGLRKLPRFKPPAKQQFYCGFRVKVATSPAEAGAGRQVYEEGRTVTWWGFTSTTTDMSFASRLADTGEDCTLFNIGGDDLWGYNIQMFSQTKEMEVLIEPEARIKVDVVLDDFLLLMMNVELLPFSKLVLEDIIPVGGRVPPQIQPQHDHLQSQQQQQQQQQNILQSPPQIALQSPRQKTPPQFKAPSLQSPPQIALQSPPQIALQSPRLKSPPQFKAPSLQSPPQIALQSPPQQIQPQFKVSFLQSPPQQQLQSPPQQIQSQFKMPTFQSPPQQQLQSPPQQSMQSPPQRIQPQFKVSFLQSPPQQQLQSPPQQIQSQFKMPTFQSPPQQQLQSPPQQSMQSPPQQQLQSPPQQPQQSLQSPPQQQLQSPLQNSLQTPPQQLLQPPSQPPPPSANTLPEGWEAKYDPKSGRCYYVDTVDKLTTWTQPPCNLALPPGWRVAYDQQKGTFYYKGAQSVADTLKVASFTGVPAAHDAVALTWALSAAAALRDVSYQVRMATPDKAEERTVVCGATPSCTIRDLRPDTEYHFWVQAMAPGCVGSWSSPIAVRTQSKWECVWKECANNGSVSRERMYVLSKKSSAVALKMVDGWSTVVGNSPLPMNSVVAWNVKILRSNWNDGGNIYVGVAPADVDQNAEYNRNNCGWYIDCFESKLCSGPPHSYGWKEYNSVKRGGQYVRGGDVVGVVVDMKKGDLSFVLNGNNLGVAYEGIPRDKPIVPCVILYWNGDSVEIVV